MTRLDLDRDRLAAYRFHARDGRPREWRVDADGARIAVRLPAPAALAAMLAAPDGVEVFRTGVTVAARPAGSEVAPEALSLDDLRDALADDLGRLETVPPGTAFGDLRLAAVTGSDFLDDYLLDVVRAWRDLCPRLPRPEAARRQPAMSDAERQAASRARRVEQEYDSAVWALMLWLTDDEDGERERPEAGARFPGAVVREYVDRRLDEALGDYAECLVDGDAEAWNEDRDGYLIPAPERPRAVGRRRLYAAAEDLGFPISFPKRIAHLTTPEVSAVIDRLNRLNPTARLIVERAAEILADEAREEVRRLLEEDLLADVLG